MLIRVFVIPPPTGEFHFSGGEAQTFTEVDWFRDDNGMMDTELGRAQIRKFVEGKGYYNSALSFLVLHPEHSFTLNYEAP